MYFVPSSESGGLPTRGRSKAFPSSFDRVANTLCQRTVEKKINKTKQEPVWLMSSLTAKIAIQLF